MGYSINDSIVVSDRIRENQKLLRHLPYAELVNRSINQTLSRTVMTSLTTLLPILALLFLGEAFSGTSPWPSLWASSWEPTAPSTW